MRESVLDVTGQEIMTQDKVTLRVNAALTYRVVDARKATCEVSDFTQTLYRDAQLALREVIGTRELDSLLTEKDVASQELRDSVQLRATDFGVSVVSLGIKDLILPGEMKELLNKVTEARKAAEAAVITRREETSAVRSQLNSAKLMEGNPTLMRLRELELVEKVAENSTLNLVLGEQGLTDRIVNLI
jgi:regulator of protease activity HflC (stomatin/prohibitin superfamily)